MCVVVCGGGGGIGKDLGVLRRVVGRLEPLGRGLERSCGQWEKAWGHWDGPGVTERTPGVSRVTGDVTGMTLGVS